MQGYYSKLGGRGSGNTGSAACEAAPKEEGSSFIKRRSRKFDRTCANQRVTWVLSRDRPSHICQSRSQTQIPAWECKKKMDGRLFRYSTEDKNLIGFVSLTASRAVCSNAIILVPGLSDGFMSLNYTEHLSKELIAINFSLVQVNLSSSFYQFGISSLQNDCKELTQLVKYIKSEYDFQKIVFLGHSTGTQDALWFAKYSEACKLIDGFILQAPVSDRDSMDEMDSTPCMLEEACKLKVAYKMDTLLSEKFEGAPITAYRYLSLAERLGDDDMFSVDLTKEELKSIIPKMQVPIALCYSAEDEFVPNMEGLRELAKRLSDVLKETSPKVDVKYFSGDHGLSKPECYVPFVEYVCNFVSAL